MHQNRRLLSRPYGQAWHKRRSGYASCEQTISPCHLPHNTIIAQTCVPFSAIFIPSMISCNHNCTNAAHRHLQCFKKNQLYQTKRIVVMHPLILSNGFLELLRYIVQRDFPTPVGLACVAQNRSFTSINFLLNFFILGLDFY